MPTILSYELPGQDELQSFDWDCTIQEGHDQGGSATQFPVEEGSKISDHIDLEPKKITLEGFVSNTPIKKMSSYPVVGDGLNRGQQAWEAITRIHRQKLLCDVYTDTEIYESMAIESLSTDKTRRKHGGLWVTINLKEVRLVEAQEVRIKDNPAPVKGPPPADDGTAARRERKQKLGRILLKFAEETERQQERLDDMAEAEKNGTTSEMSNLSLKYFAEDLARGAE